ncbi:FAD-dependent monooxygenase [Streptomyces atratus]|uniref:Salicylate hydroxylase n=1 Tax=Streptomyces atratus TaxID=1893 RepID=A0A1K2DBL1_STRAR|nr:FAD-dependent monooxygenase [Streptomyces atratus]SFY20000.1 salicylate hydroxylase [Streptomyces atratus]
MTKAKARIAIVGGGIAGLVTATLLHAHGADVRIFEQSQQFGAVGAGIQLSPNGVRVLYRLGLADALAETGVRAGAIETRRWNDGSPIARVEHGADCDELFGAPYYLIHRADLQHCLLSALPEGIVELGKGCAGVVERPDEVELHLTDGSVTGADLVIGADGVHSVVRKAVVDDEPRFSGYSVHRGLVPADVMPSFKDDPRVMFWLGPKRHVTYYPVVGGDTVHFSAVCATADGRPESSSSGRETEDLDAAFAGWHEEVRQVVTAAESVTRWGLFDRDLAARYTTDRVVLLGDAAHPTLPYLSQGANQALEDAVVLARCLREAGPGDLTPAVHRYERLRRPRTAEVHRRARELARTFHLPDGAHQVARDRGMGASQSLQHLDWLYGYDTEFALTTGPETASRREPTAPIFSHRL